MREERAAEDDDSEERAAEDDDSDERPRATRQHVDAPWANRDAPWAKHDAPLRRARLERGSLRD